MEAVTILRELSRRRALVALVALASIFAGLATVYKISLPPQSRSFEVGIANGRILVDTPDSQVVDVQPKGAGTLGIRAGVVANLMTEGDVKAAIAKRAGLRPGQLRAGVEVDGELPAVLTNAAGDPNAHLLTTSPAVNPDGTPLPMIDIRAQAPKPTDAAKLATAAVSGLNDYLNSKAGGEDVPEAQRLQVTGFGAPEVSRETHGGNRLLAVAAAIIVFLFGCAAILIGSRLAAAWRLATRLEDQPPHAEQPSWRPAPTVQAQAHAEEPAWQPAPPVEVQPRVEEPEQRAEAPQVAAPPVAAAPVAAEEQPEVSEDPLGVPIGWWRRRRRDPADELKPLKRGPAEPSRNGGAEPAEADSAPVRS
jgi:hypothetical protein